MKSATQLSIPRGHMYCKHCGKQVQSDKKFCKHCGAAIGNHATHSSTRSPNWFRQHKKKFLIGGGSLIALVVLVLWFGGDGTGTMDTRLPPITINAAKQETLGAFKNNATAGYASQDTITSFVVNILCPDNSGGGGSGGSGTVITSDGLILTNAHIIPQDANDQPTTGGCVITLPDTQGKVRAIYTGRPVIVPTVSKQYDLAFIQIDGPYTNDIGITQGPYPTTFPNFGDSGCWNNAPRLGEPVRVFGYPAISAGGNYLTVTSGEVSSLPDDGTIVISAKVDHGDSGGLAVDENGCMLGVPSQISGDGNESLGVVISDDTIGSFMSQLPNQ